MSQPRPTPSEHPAVWPQVCDDLWQYAGAMWWVDANPTLDALIADCENRAAFGLTLYDAPVKPNNGRDALLDAYEEVLDCLVYLKQRILELDGAAGAGLVSIYHRQMSIAYDLKTIMRQASAG